MVSASWVARAELWSRPTPKGDRERSGMRGVPCGDVPRRQPDRRRVTKGALVAHH